MSGFDSLCYTDCREGEGLAAGSGFGFRAASPQVDPAIMQLVQEGCLYEPPAVWIDEGRAVAEYPRSLAHIGRDGRYATASGHYLGLEVKGSRRDGNHFTHAVATDAAARYGHVRPAQLWGSRLWRDEPGPGDAWPQVAAPPEPGPLDAGLLQRWVAGQPGGEAMLLAVCSALERVHVGGSRLVFVADDPQPVLAWLAAATLLMPRQDALGVGFKVFARDASSGPHDAVALHVDWAGAFRGAGAERGFAVFDLVDGARSEVETAEAAAFWVPRFVRADCFDVLDAVELSGMFRAGAVPGRAERLAAAALALDEPIPVHELDTVLAWLADSDAATLPDRRRRELLDRLLAVEPDREQLRVLAGLADRLDDPVVRDRIRWHVFTREALAVAPGPRHGPDPHDAAAATRALEMRLDAAAPEQLSALLVVAADYGLDPDPAAFGAGLRRFVRWWADGALDVPGLDRWRCRDLVVDLLRDELAGRLRGAPEESRRSVGRLWWRRLWRTVRDPRSELDTTLAAETMLLGSDAERQQTTELVLRALGRPAPADAFDVAWRALFAYRKPAAEELLEVLDGLGPGTVPSPWAAEQVFDALSVSREPSQALLAVLVRLADLGHDPGPGRLTPWQRQACGVRRITGALSTWDPAQATLDPAVADAVGSDLGAISLEVLRAAALEVLGALARLHPEVGSEVLLCTPVAQRAALIGHLEPRDLSRDPRLTALVFVLMCRLGDVDKAAATRLAETLAASGRGMSARDRMLVGELFDERLQDRWVELCTARPSRIARWVRLGRRGP